MGRSSSWSAQVTLARIMGHPVPGKGFSKLPVQVPVGMETSGGLQEVEQRKRGGCAGRPRNMVCQGPREALLLARSATSHLSEYFSGGWDSPDFLASWLLLFSPSQLS
jgi:hypothetical protein